MPNNFVPYRSLPVNRQPVIRPLLIFDRAADRHVRVTPRSPVRRQALPQPVDTFGDEKKMQIAAQPHHFPRLGPPPVGFGNEKVGTETGVNRRTGRNFAVAFPVAPYRHVERSRADNGRSIAIEPRVHTVNIAVQTPCADFAASVPGVPERHASTGVRPWLNGRTPLQRYATTRRHEPDESRSRRSGYSESGLLRREDGTTFR